MAELLICSYNTQDSLDVYKDVKLPKRGDVHCVVPSPFDWGKGELTGFHLRILKLPDLSISSLSHLAEEEIATSSTSAAAFQMPSPMLQFRGFHLDLDAMASWHATVTNSSLLQTFFSDDNRTNPFFTIEGGMLTADILATLVVQHPARLDPAVIGSIPNVIG